MLTISSNARNITNNSIGWLRHLGWRGLDVDAWLSAAPILRVPTRVGLGIFVFAMPPNGLPVRDASLAGSRETNDDCLYRIGDLPSRKQYGKILDQLWLDVGDFSAGADIPS